MRCAFPPYSDTLATCPITSEPSFPAVGTFFFTVALLERRRQLLTEHIDDLRAVFADARQRRPFTVDAIVVLPDHLYCIWTLPPKSTGLDSIDPSIQSAFCAAKRRRQDDEGPSSNFGKLQDTRADDGYGDQLKTEIPPDP